MECPRRAEEVVREREVWASLLRLLPCDLAEDNWEKINERFCENRINAII